MLGTHPFGVYEKALPAELNWRRRLLAAGKLGFDFLEISIDESEARLDRLYQPNTAQRIQSAVQDTGVPIPSMCLSAHRRFPFGSADPAVRKRAWDIFERALELAQALNISIIQIAAYDVFYEPSTERSRALFGETLAKAGELAKRAGVLLANETMDTPFMNSISKHLALVEKIGCPSLKVYPDVGNLTAWGNDVSQELEKGISSIVQVHLKDTLAVTDSFGGQFRDVPFGSGCVAFSRCFSLLDRLGYRGGYLMEMWHRPGSAFPEQVAAAKAYLEVQYALSKGEETA